MTFKMDQANLVMFNKSNEIFLLIQLFNHFNNVNSPTSRQDPIFTSVRHNAFTYSHLQIYIQIYRYIKIHISVYSRMFHCYMNYKTKIFFS